MCQLLQHCRYMEPAVIFPAAVLTNNQSHEHTSTCILYIDLSALPCMICLMPRASCRSHVHLPAAARAGRVSGTQTGSGLCITAMGCSQIPFWFALTRIPLGLPDFTDNTSLVFS